jgi:CBS domain-containing protein
MSSTVADVMTTTVVAVRQGADFKEIVWALRHYRVSACPVIDEADRVIGVVSGTDLLSKQAEADLPAGLVRLSWRLSEQTKAAAATADQLMTAPAVVTEPYAPIAEAARLMQREQIRRLPVVDPDGRLVGIVTKSDLLSLFERPDEDIRAEVGSVLTEEFGLDQADFDVTVRRGVVTITGPVAEREDALNLLARIRHAEGVVTVRDRLGYPGNGPSGRFANQAPGSGVR